MPRNPLTFTRILVLSLAALVAGPWAHAQSPLPPIMTAPNPPPPPGYEPPNQKTDQAHTITSEVALVVLHVTVADESGGEFVTGLTQDNFRVFEDKAEQKISFFSARDIPVTMGLVIDNSGSMREKRDQVNAAALAFVRTSNPQDEAFVVNFNDEYYLDTEGDFTSDPKNLSDALSRIDTHGSTALYDATIGSLEHLKKGHKDKRVLLLITDGDDDASTNTLENTLKFAEQSDATIYAIGVFSQDDRQHDKGMVKRSTRVLTEISQVTGGAVYFPANLAQVTPICEQVAHEIRSQYSVGYYPANTAKDGTFRTVQVQLVDPPKERGKLTVRTRTGYYARKAPSSGN